MRYVSVYRYFIVSIQMYWKNRVVPRQLFPGHHLVAHIKFRLMKSHGAPPIMDNPLFDRVIRTCILQARQLMVFGSELCVFFR